MGSSPATVLSRAVVLAISGPLGTARVTLQGPPARWLDTINAQARATGVEALLTDATTALQDGTQLDPFGDGYLLLFSQARGRSARIAASTVGPADGVGFTVTQADATGGDGETAGALAAGAASGTPAAEKVLQAYGATAVSATLLPLPSPQRAPSR